MTLKTNNQNKFMFYANFLDAIEQLPKEEQANACLEFCRYGITGNLPDNKYIAMFCLGVSASVQKYQGRGGSRIGAGRPKKQENQQVNENQNIQKNQNNQNNQNEQTETININKNRNINIIKKFIKPTVEEIKIYCQERKNTVNADKFFDFYESKGWKVGNQPMKDWKAAVRTWERSATQKSSLYDKCVENGLKFLEGFDD